MTYPSGQASPTRMDLKLKIPSHIVTERNANYPLVGKNYKMYKNKGSGALSV